MASWLSTSTHLVWNPAILLYRTVNRPLALLCGWETHSKQQATRPHRNNTFLSLVVIQRIHTTGPSKDRWLLSSKKERRRRYSSASFSVCLMLSIVVSPKRSHAAVQSTSLTTAVSTDPGRALLLKGEGHQENNTNCNAMFRRNANLQKCGRCKVGENGMEKNKVLI